MFWKVAELKDAKLFCQSMNETEDVNIHSICLLKGIVLNRTVLSFPICSCFRIHKIPLILFNSIKDSCKVWGKTDPWFEKWYEQSVLLHKLYQQLESF